MAFELPLDQIICADNCDALGTFPSECIDLVVTSPPYDNLRRYDSDKPMSELWNFENLAQQLWRVIKPGGVVVWIVADATIDGSETGTSFRQALRFMEIGFRLADTMIWEKTGQGAVGAWYWSNFEFMFVMSKGKPCKFNPIQDRRNVIESGKVSTCGGRNEEGGFDTRRVIERQAFGRRFNVWKCDEQRNSEHPAPFPENLARDHILSWSNELDVVLDPFLGSGTTAKMARELGRRYIGIEVNPEYVEISKKRLAQQLLPIMG